ncbi:MAG: hypothetical protein Q8L47_00835 [bacterium]|nr:hypothetical protein [bacterium]
MENKLSVTVKYIIGWTVVFAVRLIPFRMPNVEPVMATLMPYSKRYGILGAFLFGLLSIALYDIAVGKAGQWTVVTAVTYGVIGIASAIFFNRAKSSRKNYVTFAFFGTIFYDAITGVAMGPILFGGSYSEAFFGQIPFTLYHLAGNIVFAFILSPALYNWVVTNPKLSEFKFLQVFG